MPRPMIVTAVLGASALAACAPGVDPPVSKRSAMRFDTELAGLAPGRPQSCLSSRSSANVVAARGGTLLFREGRMVYANETGGGCSDLADNQYALVTESFGGSLCRGSIARVVDLTGSGMVRGTCVLGDFTPYRRP